jgi:CRISPR-associated protein Cas2
MVNIDFDQDENQERRKVKTYFIVVVYDMSDNKKRYKFHKAMKAYGTWVQRSSFECFLKDSQLQEMKSTLQDLIDPKTDMLRIYKISHTPKIWTYGSIGEVIDEDFVVI